MKKVFSYINTANKIFSILSEITETISQRIENELQISTFKF